VAAFSSSTTGVGFGAVPLLLLSAPSPDFVHSVRRSGRGDSDTAPRDGSRSRSARIAGSRGVPRAARRLTTSIFRRSFLFVLLIKSLEFIIY